MNPQKVSSRYFVHLKRAWYAEVTLRETPFVDEVCFGTVPASGAGTYGEMAVRWYRLDHVLAPRLEVFDDGWRLLADFGEILQAMAQVRTGRNVAIAPAAFCLLLQECGFVDRTPVECPPLLRSRRPTDALRPDRDRTDGPTR
ncbi:MULTISPECIES: hypothetical protein [Burkholderiaceae]|uniref:Uncharacterized protein n=2 Tax=Burkholderiaceae TaxID=119060 RepID=B2T0X3_PARPJ|nr:MULTISPECIES: hypothetical protein [Burkholderiaceae]MDP9546033.1 hypothetical protein [Burkholderia cepacia]UTP22409.1 hypothetical protein NMB33_00630 [Burkholderia sp. FXe9]ACD14693.1 hypothetical protein Bphyt_0266 [Paraburkholderia phytofirmans PsJN]MBR8391265.1 hypothetical protein [Burkholderia cenocepacia]MBR8473718.1 hypothetical protein [Burkholderia cenocepacia]